MKNIAKKLVLCLTIAIFASTLPTTVAYATEDKDTIIIECENEGSIIMADAAGTCTIVNGTLTINYDNAPIRSIYTKLDRIEVVNNQHVEPGDTVGIESKEFGYYKECTADSSAGNIGLSTDLIYKEKSYREEIADYACEFVGNPYVWGGTSLTDGADCSGFVQTLFGIWGINTPRCADEQYFAAEHITEDELEKGDLIFYGSSIYEIKHVAIYLGDGRIVHAKGKDYGIVIDDDYNYSHIAGFGRY